MTPAARLSAAMSVLDAILTGQVPEVALSHWGRASRFAGSGDRYAVRDLVFDALRCKRSFAALGGGLTGRGLILGAMRAQGADLDALFTGIGHAPAPLGDADAARTPTIAEALDVPDWLLPDLRRSFGADCDAVLRALQSRAPVFLRVNTHRVSPAQAQAELAAEGVVTQLTPLVKTALQVTEGARKIQNTRAYLSGMVELQDAHSQAVIAALTLPPAARILDYCAGGGGKTLAMAAKTGARIFAHDDNPRRMAGLPARAARAGAEVTILENPAQSMAFDLILTDVPCSGSGSWRRDPAGKWALTPERLAQLCHIQAAILDETAALLAPHGTLAYATCSLLQAENEDQISAFLARHSRFTCAQQTRFSPLAGGDGFFLALLQR